MIFATINNDLDGILNKTGLFKKSFINIFKDTKNQGVFTGLFSGKGITTTDIANIQAMDSAMKNGSTVAQAWQANMQNCTVAAKQQVKQCIANKKSLSDLVSGLNATTISAKATEIGLTALNIAGNMFAMWAVSKLITGLYKLTQVSKDVAASASEMSSSFSSTKSDIENYKQAVKELYETINDSSSSISDVTEARKQLMSIQDELIEKYGTEQTSIDAITKAIKGETSAWKELTETKWQELKNEFNDGGFWNSVGNFFSGYEDNLERMQEEYGEYTATIEFGSISGNDKRKQAEDLLKEFGMFSKTANGTGVGKIELSGNATEVYDQLLKIQNLVDKSGIDFGSSFDSQLRDLANAAKETSTQYKDLYNQFVLNEKILKNSEDGYADSFKNITDKYDAYQNAINSNDEEKAKSSTEDFVKTVTEEMDKAFTNGDSDVADYFRNMYPELQDEIDSWNFDVKFETNTDNLKDDVSGSLKKMGGLSKEELLGFNLEAATDEQRQGYAELEAVANKYHLSIDELIDRLEILGLVSSESYQNLVDKFGQDAVEKLSPEDLQIALTISTEEADKAIEEEKKKAEEARKYLSGTGLQDLIYDYDDDGNDLLPGNNSPFKGYLVHDVQAWSLQADYQLARVEEKAKETGNTVEGIWTKKDAIDEYADYGDIALQGLIKSKQQLENPHETTISDVFALKDASDNATTLSKLKDQLSEVETAYQTCLSAKEEYDAQGYLSVETLEKVLSLGEEYLQYLFDEQGNVKLDAEAFQNLALARINAMEAEALSNLAKDIEQITNEATATDYLAKKQNELANSYTDVAASALLALHSIDGFSDSEALQGAYDSLNARYEQIKGLFASTKQGLGASFSGKSNATYTIKDQISAYMDFQKKSLEKGKIDYDTYSSNVSNYLKNMWKSGKISAKEYYDYTGEMLENQKSIMDKVISAVQNRIDKEIDGIKLQQDEIQKKIDLLNDENDANQRAYNLEKARYELEKLQTQRTKKLYLKDTGYVYRTDDEAVRDAKDNLADLELEEVIAGLEKEKDALDDSIDALEKYKDKWNQIASEYENTQNEMYAAQVLGADWEDEILATRTDTLNNFKETYLEIQQAIVDAAWNSANEQNKALASVGDFEEEPVIEQANEILYKKETPHNGVNNQHSVKYGTGTDNAKPGIHEVSEKGDEIIIDNDGNAMLAKGRQLHQFEGGETVIKASTTAELLKNYGNLVPVKNVLDGIDPAKIMQSLPPLAPNFNYNNSPASKPNVQSTTVSIGDIHLHEVQNVKDFAAELNRHLPSISVQYNANYRR